MKYSNNFKKTIIQHETPTRKLEIEKFCASINLNKIKINKSEFDLLCKNGCKNYGLKYSCPPFSPDFNDFAKGYDQLNVVCYRLFLYHYDPLPTFHRIRASNSILKSRIDRELLSIRRLHSHVVGSGSCRACKHCAAKEKKKCKKPNRRIYSLEALGVNVDILVKTCFNFSLEWYFPKNKSPEYNCTVGGYLTTS